MLTPYPEITPYRSGSIDIDETHLLHFDETGNPEGLPVFVLHDGPGGGSDAFHRRLFDAERFRIIQYDQRGCGRSLPLADMEHCQVSEAVSDLRMLMSRLELEKVSVVGFGWGARIASELCKATPDLVNGLILCGYGFCGRESMEWLLEYGAPKLFPDYYQELVQRLGNGSSDALMQALEKMLLGANELDQIQAAKAWAKWLAKISTLHCQAHLVDQYSHPHYAISLAKLGVTVFKRLSEMPAEDSGIPESVASTIVHGRYDAVTPLESAHSLHRQSPGSELVVVRDAGHSPHDPAMTDVMIKVIGQMADRLGGYGKLNG
ncbi:alpha/beta fold hydrolase [Hahella ganghwensis]|uniref:alpha/beta fold hydrolase n=1 Tax=Hahella ganghwensis TaxID=286420 RepID=UPI000377D28B|nr:alpha/beta fold hydrolase [Hahella ganghwensis]